MPPYIPLVLLEEHHESFYLWHYAIKKGWLKSSGNSLLHFDEHSDLGLPPLRTPLQQINTLNEIASFTYNQLGIGNFIWPAVYQGLFDEFFWISRHRKHKLGKRLGLVWLEGDDPLTLAFRITSNMASAVSTSGCKAIDVTFTDTSEPIAITGRSLVLDIDIDCILSYDAPQGRFACEITRQEYLRFLSDPYHPFRLLWGQRLNVEEHAGGYWLVAHTFSAGKAATSVSEKEILARIEDLMQFIAAQRLQPALISVCRSVRSGYTPPRWASLIEEMIVMRVSELFPIKQCAFQEMLSVADYPEAAIGAGSKGKAG